MTFFNLPPSVIWFGVFAILGIFSGLHLGHIYAVGFFEYQKELIKKFNLSALEARKQANQQIWFNWGAVTVCAVAAIVCCIISIRNLINGQ